MYPPFVGDEERDVLVVVVVGGGGGAGAELDAAIFIFIFKKVKVSKETSNKDTFGAYSQIRPKHYNYLPKKIL